MGVAFFAIPSLYINAQESASDESEESSEEQEDKEIINQITLPPTVPAPISSGIESNTLIQLSSSGVDSTAAATLGVANLRLITDKLTATTAAERATQLKTYINVIDAYSNVASDSSTVGRRAINPSADLSTIVNSTVTNLTADHISTLGKLDVSHMKTFASDGIAKIDNFATRVDVTSAMVGSSLDTLDTTKLTSLVDNLHSSLDGDSLTALKSLEKSHMTTLVGTGDKKIDLTASFDASVIKKSVKKFATKAEVTVEFAKAAAPTSGGTVDLSKVDLGAIATNIHANLDDDHLTALQQLSPTHMASMATGVDITKTDINVGTTLTHFATKAEVVVEFAKAAVPTAVADAAGALDFSTIKIDDFVTNVHASLDTDHTAALANLDPTHMATMAKGTDLTSGLKVADLSHFATKAEVVVEFAKVAAPTAAADASGKFDFSAIKIEDFVSTANTLDTDSTKALANLDPVHMATMAKGTDLSAGLKTDDLTHFATKAEVVVEFAKVAAPTAAADASGKFDFSAVKIEDFVTTANTLDVDNTKALAKLDPTHMATMAKGTDLSAGLKADDLSHFATKGELASVYVDAGGTGVDIASIVTNIQTTITVEFTTSLKEFDPTHMATMATGVDITAIASVGHKAKVAHAYKETAGTSANVADILTNVSNIKADDLANFAELDHTKLKSIATSVDISKVHEDAAHKAKAVAAGYSIEDAVALTGDALAAIGTSTKDDLKIAREAGTSLNDHAGAAQIAGTKNSDNAEIDTAAKAVKTDAKAKGTVYESLAGANGFQAALESAVKVAELLLTDRVLNTEEDLPSGLTVTSLSANGYNAELIRILAKYGALGSKGSELSDAVLGTDFRAFDKSFGLGSKVQPNTSYYQQFLTKLGARAFGPSKTSNNIFSVSTSNIEVSPGANITFNKNAKFVPDFLEAKGDRRLAIVGAAKDMTIKGNLRIKNSNTTENGALVLGAADDLYFRSEYSPANSADYTGNPSVVFINNEGANLALGSEDTMRLVNVSISTGGNLAIGTLNELHIGLSDGHSSTFTVGNGGQNSDPDNIYLYADKLIQINGLNITGRVDDVYMEAVTVNLRNVTFPNTSEVTLRSRDGTVGFNNFSTPILGGVNMTNVKHGSNTLAQGSFHGIPGKFATHKVLPNGTPAVQVKKF